MKRLFSLASVAALGLLAACSAKGVNIYDSDPASALNACVTANAKPEWNIKELRFDQAPEAAPFTDVMGKASVLTVDSSEKEQAFEISLVDKTVKEVNDPSIEARAKIAAMRANAPGAPAGDFAGGNYGKAADLDFSRVRSNLDAAGKMISKEGFENAGTDHYTITLNQDKAKAEHRFTLNAKNKNATKLEGKRIVTDYFQVDFVADSAGNVRMLESK